MNVPTPLGQSFQLKFQYRVIELVNENENKCTVDDLFLICSAITSPNYPNTFDKKRLNCKWSIKALHGARVRVRLVDADLNDGCFDNILQVVDDTPASGRSRLKYPGKSAKCGQSNFGSVYKGWETNAGRTVSVSFRSLKNNGSATFKLEVTANVPKACPGPEPSGCPDGPCCSGVDCCILKPGKVGQGKFIFVSLNIFLNFLIFRN